MYLVGRNRTVQAFVTSRFSSWTTRKNSTIKFTYIQCTLQIHMHTCTYIMYFMYKLYILKGDIRSSISFFCLCLSTFLYLSLLFLPSSLPPFLPPHPIPLLLFFLSQVAPVYFLTFLLFLHIYVRPYKYIVQNIIEAVVLFDYCLLFLLRSPQTLLESLSSYSGTSIQNTFGSNLPSNDGITYFFWPFFYFPVFMGIAVGIAWIMYRIW